MSGTQRRRAVVLEHMDIGSNSNTSYYSVLTRSDWERFLERVRPRRGGNPLAAAVHGSYLTVSRTLHGIRSLPNGDELVGNTHDHVQRWLRGGPPDGDTEAAGDRHENVGDRRRTWRPLPRRAPRHGDRVPICRITQGRWQGASRYYSGTSTMLFSTENQSPVTPAGRSVSAAERGTNSRTSERLTAKTTSESR